MSLRSDGNLPEGLVENAVRTFQQAALRLAELSGEGKPAVAEAVREDDFYFVHTSDGRTIPRR